MKNRKTIYDEAKKIWRTVVKIDTTHPLELKLEFELHKKLLNLFHPGSYHYYVFNIFHSEFEFVSPSITNVLGYTSEEMNVLLFIELIHPDDKPYFLQFEHQIAHFFKQLPFEEIENYKAQYDIRLKAKDGKYVRVLHQAVQIDYDEENFYRTLSVDSDITHIKAEGIPNFSLIGLNGLPSYFNIPESSTLNKCYSVFTKREREILKMIVEDKSTSAIADTLSVSQHTVNAHRKSILIKAGVKTPVALVCKAIREGWI